MFIANLSPTALDEAYRVLPAAYRDEIMCEERKVAETPFWSRDEHRLLLESRTADVLRSLLLLCHHYAAELVKEEYESNDGNLWRRTLHRSASSLAFALDYDHTKRTYPEKDFWDLTNDPRHADAAHAFLPSTCALLPNYLERGPVGVLRWLERFKPVVAGFDGFLSKFQVPYDSSDGEGIRVGFCTYHDFYHFRLRPDQELHPLLVGVTRRLEPLPLSAYRFSLLSGEHLFLSEIKRKSVEELGLKDGDVILRDVTVDTGGKERMEAWCRDIRKEYGGKYGFATDDDDDNKTNAEAEEGRRQPRGKKNKSATKRQRQKKKKAKKAARRTHFSAPPDEGAHRIEHSRNLSRVLDEADSVLRDIRRRLNDLNLKRTPPKRVRPARSDRKTTNGGGALSAASFDPDRTAGGRAGTVFFDVRVGDAACLYKSGKPRRGGGLDRSAPAAAIVDLHGRTREEGRAELNSRLPEWVRTAMEGPRPWVIRVRIVVGGGNQVLAEMVEDWIGKNESVARAFGN